jgi:hypothetical protein
VAWRFEMRRGWTVYNDTLVMWIAIYPVKDFVDKSSYTFNMIPLLQNLIIVSTIELVVRKSRISPC